MTSVERGERRGRRGRDERGGGGEGEIRGEGRRGGRERRGRDERGGERKETYQESRVAFNPGENNGMTVVLCRQVSRLALFCSAKQAMSLSSDHGNFLVLVPGQTKVPHTFHSMCGIRPDVQHILN